MDMSQSSTVTFRGSKDVFLPIEFNIILYYETEECVRTISQQTGGRNLQQHQND